ncbi:hypothetical protein [Thalassolituus marinus]|uniref:Uncharacterized protein n=1 Tax=Thalassolituus marinus TaxID=671053 RepID=A0ABS7ZRD6_9GAMM|nr:hypothetical protein [Thalassolituus marinus]MCA6064309.1 hypothetical protein [Thalassolituus marinus]
MMIVESYANFLPLMPSDAGRKVFIDPELIVDFAEYIDPQSEDGKAIVSQIIAELSSSADALSSGKAIGIANEFYRDFGDINGHSVRAFYTIFQDSPPNTNKGSGVYIHKIRRYEKNMSSVPVGLFNMTYQARGWQEQAISGTRLTQNVLRIGAGVSNGTLIELPVLSRIMLEATNQKDYKTDFNLYHAPLATIEFGAEYQSPESRRKIIDPQGLANILRDSVVQNRWVDNSSLKHESYNCYVYGDGAKILQEAVKLLIKDGKTLSGFQFHLVSPTAPFTQLKASIESSGATVSLHKGLPISVVSQRHQKLDSNSLDQNSLKVRSQYETFLSSNPKASFIELWNHMKNDLLALGV